MEILGGFLPHLPQSRVVEADKGILFPTPPINLTELLKTPRGDNSAAALLAAATFAHQLGADQQAKAAWLQPLIGGTFFIGGIACAAQSDKVYRPITDVDVAIPLDVLDRIEDDSFSKGHIKEQLINMRSLMLQLPIEVQPLVTDEIREVVAKSGEVVFHYFPYKRDGFHHKFTDGPRVNLHFSQYPVPAEKRSILGLELPVAPLEVLTAFKEIDAGYRPIAKVDLEILRTAAANRSSF